MFNKSAIINLNCSKKKIVIVTVGTKIIASRKYFVAYLTKKKLSLPIFHLEENIILSNDNVELGFKEYDIGALLAAIVLVHSYSILASSP